MKELAERFALSRDPGEADWARLLQAISEGHAIR
jgi:hypothetical protein